MNERWPSLKKKKHRAQRTGNDYGMRVDFKKVESERPGRSVE